MGSARRLSAAVAVVGLTALLVLDAPADISLRDTSSDRPLVLDQNTDYLLHGVNITGVRDSAALTLTGKIASVRMRKCIIGNVRSGDNGRAAGVEAVGASVGSFVASDSIFYDCENQLASLKEGTFGFVSFQRCAFRASPEFLKDVYDACPWRDWPPVTEFYNIDRLELIDNQFANTIILIHPSVRKIIIRGEIPGLHVEDKEATQVIRLAPGQDPRTVDPVAVASTK
jgi:hypothetical protein